MLIHRLSNKFGKLFFQSNAQITQNDFYNRVKKSGLPCSVIYDIGAHHGDFSIALKNIFQKSKFYMFEADSKKEKFLKETGLLYYIALLSNTSGQKYFYTNNSSGDSYYKETTKFYQNTTPTVVNAVTLDNLVDAQSLPPPDIIKIDTQGSELDVLKGGLKTILNSTLIHLECPIIEYNQGSPRLHEIVSFMATLNFIPSDIIECHTGIDGLIQVDIAFLKAESLKVYNSRNLMK
jgi:FkbM family methyltransferase